MSDTRIAMSGVLFEPQRAGVVGSSDDATRRGTDQPLIEAGNLTLHSSERTLLRGLDWRCRAGERWCVIGRNAVGKTTLLRALAGLPVARREGRVAWQGRDQRDCSPETAAALRAFMHQHSQDRFSISVQRLLDLAVCVPQQSAHDVQSLIEPLDIADLLHRDAMRLSGGERQRVALAQCAMQGSPLMLLDEPVAFQDPAHQAQVADWLVERAAGSSALVMSAHDVNWMARAATHVLSLMGDGSWHAGPAESMLTPEHLEAVYGCRWTRSGDALLIAR